MNPTIKRVSGGKLGVLAGMAVSALVALPLNAAMAGAPVLKKLTAKGELLDMACYSTMNMTGRAHGKTCGKKCLASGLPAGILLNGQAYTLLTNPKPLAKYVGVQIKVVGKEDVKDKVIYPTKIWWRMGDMWMKVHLTDNLHH